MLLELVKNYKNEIQKLKEAYEENLVIEELQSSLLDSENFLQLDISKLLEILERTNYQEYSLEKIKTTILYIQRNNLYQEVSDFIDKLVNYLDSIKYATSLSEEECDSLLKRIDTVLNDIESNEKFLSDFDLIIKILKEKKTSRDDILTIMKEIYDKNALVFSTYQKENQLVVTKPSDEIEIIDDSSEETIFDLLKACHYNQEFTPLEEKLLKSLTKEELKAKLDFFEVTPEYNFLKEESSLEYHRLLVILLLIPINNISTIYQLALRENIDFKKILPTFYIDLETAQKLNYLLDNSDNLGITKEERRFYHLAFVNNYENFLEVGKLFKELGYVGDSYTKETIISSLIKTNPNLFMTSVSTIENNLRTFSDYGVMVRSPAVLKIDNPSELLDKFIEADLLNYVRDHQSILLNKDEALFHRIYYARMNNLEILRGSRYLSSNITSVDGYQINADNCQDKVETYTPSVFDTPFYQGVLSKASEQKNYKKFENNLIAVLDASFKVDDATYLMMRQRISRLKVLRLFQAFTSQNTDVNPYYGLFFAIFHNTLLTKDTYSEIVTKIMRLYYLHSMVTEEEVYEITNSLGISKEKVDSLIASSKGGK